MTAKRLGMLAVYVLGLVFTLGAAQAGATGSPRVLKLIDHHIVATPVGFSESSSAIPPIGAREVFTGLLLSDVPEFGKPVGAAVGHILLDCTVLTETPDGLCTGIAHVPDGFFTFAGNGPFTNTTVRYYAITGGVGPYAQARGELKVTIISVGRSLIQVTLYP